jgi:Ser/Thr protein kinase RdoA (MazF antagonist)
MTTTSTATGGRLGRGVDNGPVWPSNDVLAAVSSLIGSEARLDGPMPGQSGASFLLASGAGPLVLKLVPDRPGALADQERLVRLVEGLRQRGYPAPTYAGAGRAAGCVFTVQHRLPGGPARTREELRAVLPDLLGAIELQKDAGDLADPPWPGWLLETIAHGGDGYCLHETLRRRPDTAKILDRLIVIAARNAGSAPRRRDVVHFDLNPTNVLHEAGRLSGIVDWNVPFAGAAQGDRGFDVATLLFYAYDVEEARAPLWEAATRTSGPAWTAVYLCHLTLRQLEWTVRHRPGSAEEVRFMAVADRVLTDCAAPGSGQGGSLPLSQ